MTSILILAVLFAADTAGPDSTGRDSTLTSQTLETIAYSADSLVFYPDNSDLILVGSATLDYRDMTLKSDTVEYSNDDEIITARGESELFDRGESITGDGMIYSIPTRKGRILNAASQYDFGFYTGATITRVGPNEFNIVDARFTTCDDDTIHYHFYCPLMKVFPPHEVWINPPPAKAEHEKASEVKLITPGDTGMLPELCKIDGNHYIEKAATMQNSTKEVLH